MKLRFNITIGILFILAGGLLSSSYIINYVRGLNTNASAAPLLISQQLEDKSIATIAPQSLPANVSIPSINLSVDVEPGYYNTTTQTWTLNDTEAFFATISTPPNSVTGNTYIYGHNRGNVFNPLNDTSIGTNAIVSTTDNKTFTYKLSAVHDVTPNDSTWLIAYKGNPILTLQTCAGFWDQYRRLFIFDFVSET